MDATAQALLKVIEYLVFKDLGLGVLYAGITYYLVYALVRARSGSPVSVPVVPAQPGGPVVLPPPVVIPPPSSGDGGDVARPPPPPPAPVDRFPTAIAFTLDWEGGNDDDPRDPGGRTSRGILQREWDTWRQTHPGLPSDVWQAPQDQVLAIYRQNYWEAMSCDKLPAGVDFAVFDYGVNSGISRAAKVLQKIVGVSVDGEIGPDTIAAVSKVDPATLIGQICDQRLAFLQGLSTWGTFGKGWTLRVQGVRKEALGMVGGATNSQAPTSIAPLAPVVTGDPPWITLGRTFDGLVWHDDQVMPPQIQAWMDNIATTFPEMAPYCKSLKALGARGWWAWCGAFVQSMLAYSKIRGPISAAGLQGQTTTADWAYVDAWRPWGTKVWDADDGTDINDAPVQNGDVLIWKTPKIHHVSFYGKPLPDTNTFDSLGGDQGDPLRVCEEQLDMSWCVAIRRPPTA